MSLLVWLVVKLNRRPWLRQLKSLPKTLTSISAGTFIPEEEHCVRHIKLGCSEAYSIAFPVIYASKRRLGSTMTLHTLEAVNSLEHTIQPQRTHTTAPRSFRVYGEVRTHSPWGFFSDSPNSEKAGYVPKDAYNIVALSKTVGICTSGGIITADASK